MGVVSASSSAPGGDSPPETGDVPSPREHSVRGSAPTGSAPDRFQILALDGGGAKALFTAHVLARLEQDLGVSIKDSFDLIAGTSAGGIVALGFGTGLAPSEIVSHYEELVETVFPVARPGPPPAQVPAWMNGARVVGWFPNQNKWWQVWVWSAGDVSGRRQVKRSDRELLHQGSTWSDRDCSVGCFPAEHGIDTDSRT